VLISLAEAKPRNANA